MTVTRTCIAEPYRDCRAQIGELPRRFEREGVTLHSGRNLIKRLGLSGPGGEPIEVAVKAFAVPARVRGFVYANLRRSKARRCMTNAEKLAQLGIGTPDPVACIEYEDYRCLRRSYYVCRYWPHDHDLGAVLWHGFRSGADAQEILTALARFTAAQHDRGVLHLDYNPGNILARSKSGGIEFALVDLNRLRFRHLDMKDRISGLARLTTRDDCLRIIGWQYARLVGADPDEFCSRLATEQRRFAVARRRMKKALSWFRR